MGDLISATITKLKATKLGLIPVDENEGIFHFKVKDQVNEAEALAKMSEFEANGFFYQGIKTMVGKDGFMIFANKPVANSLA